MAENLVIPLFLGGLTLLLKPATRTNSFIAGLIAVSFYATKFVLLPLTGTYLVVYALKVLLERRSLKSLFPLSAAVTGSFLILYSFEKLYQGQELLTVVTSAFNAYLTNSSTDPQIARSITGEQYFNQSYFELNIKQYMFGLIGGELVNFGQDHPLFPWFVGFIGTGGLVGNLFIKKWRLFFASLLLIVIVNVFFICTFYATDGRYIIYTIPLILLSFSITADRLMQWLSHKKKLIIGYLVLAFFGLSYVGMSFPQFRQTITEHITGRDQPNSHYQFIQTINQAPISSDQPILITGLFPYYIDLFSKKYELLPLSPRGYLMESVETIYGISPQIPLKEIYQQALRDHRAVYVSNYQVNDWNKRYLHADFETLSQEFTLTLVQEGCGGECNLYQLSLHEL